MQDHSIDVLFLAFGKFPLKNADFTSARKARLFEAPRFSYAIYNIRFGATSLGPSVSEICILGNFS